MTGEGLAGRTVLVTGGAGFIGSHIADALVEDNEVRVLDRFSSGETDNVPENATLVQGDVRDRDLLRETMREVDVVFHEAGLVSVDASIEDPLYSHATNASATVEVLEAARQEDVRVVFASSSAVYGTPETVPVPEDAPKEPESPYGIDKLAADHYVRAYEDLYGLPTVALRYFNVYGLRQGGEYSGVIDIFLDQALAGDPITVDGDGSQTRDFVHVDDVVRANLLAATTANVGRAYNVGTGRAVSVRELAETVQRVTETDSSIVHTDPRPGDVQHSCADVSRARRELGVEAEIDLETGLRDLVGGPPESVPNE